jgi:hypothetical protein
MVYIKNQCTFAKVFEIVELGNYEIRRTHNL